MQTLFLGVTDRLERSKRMRAKILADGLANIGVGRDRSGKTFRECFELLYLEPL